MAKQSPKPKPDETPEEREARRRREALCGREVRVGLEVPCEEDGLQFVRLGPGVYRLVR